MLEELRVCHKEKLGKGKRLYLKAGELGYAAAYFNLGGPYAQGTGVDIDMKRAKYYCELAAMNGNVSARYNLGALEENASNHQRAKKHLYLQLGLDTTKLWIK